MADVQWGMLQSLQSMSPMQSAQPQAQPSKNIAPDPDSGGGGGGLGGLKGLLGGLKSVFGSNPVAATNSALTQHIQQTPPAQVANTVMTNGPTGGQPQSISQMPSNLPQSQMPQSQLPGSTLPQGLPPSLTGNGLSGIAQRNNLTPQASPNQQGLLGPQATNQQLAPYTSQGVNMNLNPQFSSQLPAFINDLKQQGYQPTIASGFRTPEEQAKKVAEGASHTMHSNHMSGNAVDIVDKRYGWNTEKYGPQIKQYADAMAKTAEKYGLMSGTQWKSFGPYGDFAHIQFTGGKQAPTPISPQVSSPSSQAFSNIKDPHPELQATMAGIAHVESSGAKNPYTLTSIPSKNGDRAYGKYQIMGSNIPSWTKAATGQKMTPQEFIKNPEAQEKTAAYMVNKDLHQYGNSNDAFSTWFSGRPVAKAGNAKDAYGTSVPQYLKKANEGYQSYKDQLNKS